MQCPSTSYEAGNPMDLETDCAMDFSQNKLDLMHSEKVTCPVRISLTEA
jgi:hypothetical protein